MYITVTNFKGGVAKTTTAVHVATYLQELGPTLLIDGDPNRSATQWKKRGALPFEVLDPDQGTYQARNFEHVVIDTEARPGPIDMEGLAKGCDLMIIPTVPATLDSEATAKTLAAINRFAPGKYRVLITKAPPYPQKDALTLRTELINSQVPVFDTDIPFLKAFEEAAAKGVCVSQIRSPNAQRAWQAYVDVGRQILIKEPEELLHAASK
jgi:chromosome partitioning protein